jgi:hypothetical protein
MSAIFSIIKKANPKKGVTLIEALFYVVVLTIASAVIVQMLLSMTATYKKIKVSRELESVGAITMEAMLREIRNGSAVVVGQSTFDVSPGTLTISGTDDGGIMYSVKFDVSNGSLRIAKNGGTPEELTSTIGKVESLVFKYLTNSNTEGVRIELVLKGTFGTVVKTEKFYGFAVLRGSY